MDPFQLQNRKRLKGDSENSIKHTTTLCVQMLTQRVVSCETLQGRGRFSVLVEKVVFSQGKSIKALNLVQRIRRTQNRPPVLNTEVT